MVITEIDRMYKLTFEQLCTLSEYPNYWQSIRKLMLVWTRREKLQRAHIRMEHLITWCQDRSLSADLISDIPIAQNNNTPNFRAYLSDDTNEANCCQNPKCIQTIGVRERTLIQIIEEYGQYNDGILYQENFNAMIREIHQCGTCKCPKTVLELAKVFRHTYYTIRFFILLNNTHSLLEIKFQYSKKNLISEIKVAIDWRRWNLPMLATTVVYCCNSDPTTSDVSLPLYTFRFKRL